MNFVLEEQFECDLALIESCPIRSDRLLRRIEAKCRGKVRRGASGYGLIRLLWKSRRLLAWYLATGCTVSLLSLGYDPK